MYTPSLRISHAVVSAHTTDTKTAQRRPQMQPDIQQVDLAPLQKALCVDGVLAICRPAGEPDSQGCSR